MAARCAAFVAVMLVSMSAQTVLGMTPRRATTPRRAMKLSQQNTSSHGRALHAVSSASPPSFAIAAPAPAPFTAPASAGMCGCAFEAQCTCAESFRYQQCVTQRCAEGCAECSAHPMTKQCGLLNQRCGSELKFECTPKQITCRGLFHQARDGITGLTLHHDHISKEAYCGSNGHCLGHLHFAAQVRFPEAGSRMECELPRFAGALEDHDDAWLRCGVNVSSRDSTARCAMPMVGHLDPRSVLRGRCWLTDAQGKKTSKGAWFTVRNQHADRDGGAVRTAKEEIAEAADDEEPELEEDKPETLEEPASRQRSTFYTSVLVLLMMVFLGLAVYGVVGPHKPAAARV